MRTHRANRSTSVREPVIVTVAVDGSAVSMAGMATARASDKIPFHTFALYDSEVATADFDEALPMLCVPPAAPPEEDPLPPVEFLALTVAEDFVAYPRIGNWKVRVISRTMRACSIPSSPI